MIKTPACHKAESTVLSNHAVNCHNTTMNEVQCPRQHRWRDADEAPDPGALAKFYSELLGWPGYLAAVWPPVDGAGLEGLFAV